MNGVLDFLWASPSNHNAECIRKASFLCVYTPIILFLFLLPWTKIHKEFVPVRNAHKLAGFTPDLCCDEGTYWPTSFSTAGDGTWSALNAGFPKGRGPKQMSCISLLIRSCRGDLLVFPFIQKNEAPVLLRDVDAPSLVTRSGWTTL